LIFRRKAEKKHGIARRRQLAQAGRLCGAPVVAFADGSTAVVVGQLACCEGAVAVQLAG
jgi:hypothetical protein